jgi:hypothetical protein
MMQTKLFGFIIFSIVFNVVHSTVFNIRDYGATGDGTTDDTRAVLKAISNCTDNGGVLYIPSGTYVIRSSLIFKMNNQFTISGDGMSSVLLWGFDDHLIVILPAGLYLNLSWNTNFSVNIFRK